MKKVSVTNTAVFDPKKLLFSAASLATSVLPVRLRHVLATSLLNDPSLVRQYGYRYLSGLAGKLNVVRLSASGEYGTMSSSSKDVWILRAYAESGRWAFHLSERLVAFFSETGGTYLDIGANIGMTSIPILQQNPAVQCYAFEPEPVNYQNLLLNISVNCPSSHIRPFQLALHERKGMLPFEISDTNLGAHRLHVETGLAPKLAEDSRRVTEVACERLDDLPIELRHPVFVKIDTEGAEPFVVAGGRHTLAQADAILLEWHPYNMARLGADPTVVLDFLETHFQYGEIEHTDAKAGQPGRRGSIKEITGQLAGTIEEWKNDPSQYLDIIGIRNHNGVADPVGTDRIEESEMP
ncbi:FkbM family methyltransferase [Paraburkholderia sp. CI3]